VGDRKSKISGGVKRGQDKEEILGVVALHGQCALICVGP
jgi:hypothetical protein